MVSRTSSRRLSLALLAVALPLLCVGAIRLSAAGSQDQQPSATFRTQVNLVQVDAVVLDGKGQFVPDLRKDEFEILENGKPQQIGSVLAVRIPIERVEAPLYAGAEVVKPDVQTNAKPVEGRLFLIVLDDLQVDSKRSLIARRLAREFIEKNVAPNDFAAIVPTSGNRKTSQELTSDRALMLRAVDQFIGQKIESPGTAAFSMSNANGEGRAQETDFRAPQRIYNARATLQTLADLARFAGRIKDRRKAMVYISEGIDYGFGQVGEMKSTKDQQPLGFLHDDNVAASREVRDRLREFVETANRGNVTLYAFDPRVYTGAGDEFIDIGSGAPDDMTKFEGDNVKSTRQMNDLEASQDNLRVLASETGGFAATGSPKALENAFERVRNETSNYYLIGYYPGNDARDGKFRKIEVRVKRPGVRVEARKGYVAPKGNAPAQPAVDAKEGTSPALREALGSPLPVSGLTLRASAVPFKGADKNASVVVIIQANGDNLKFTPKGDKLEDSLELSAVAIDKTGRTRDGIRTTIDMPLSPKLHDFVRQAGLVFALRLNVPPGQYQVRVAGRDAGSELVGSVHCELEVPDFSQLPLSMSGLVVTAAQAGQVPNPKPDEDLKGMLPSTPITTREFAANDRLTLLAEVYDNNASQPHSVRITTTVRGDDGRTVVSQTEERSTSELAGARGGFIHTTQIPMDGLKPGLYVLEVAAVTTLDPDTVVNQKVQFRVR